jgi:hypothetical protein
LVIEDLSFVIGEHRLENFAKNDEFLGFALQRTRSSSCIHPARLLGLGIGPPTDADCAQSGGADS